MVFLLSQPEQTETDNIHIKLDTVEEKISEYEYTTVEIKQNYAQTQK